MLRRLAIPLALVLILAACGSKAETKRYPMEGTIKALDVNAKSATIDAGKIGDWMDAMTMEYSVKPDAEFQKLHVGDRIKATVVVTDATWYVTGVTVLPKS